MQDKTLDDDMKGFDNLDFSTVTNKIVARPTSCIWPIDIFLAVP